MILIISMIIIIIRSSRRAWQISQATAITLLGNMMGKQIIRRVGQGKNVEYVLER
ncbi:MAG: hypothetical protein GX345_00550 [Clostridiales bacterium]|nr:hypothetical protein [Clostridiales bacterium]